MHLRVSAELEHLLRRVVISGVECQRADPWWAACSVIKEVLIRQQQDGILTRDLALCIFASELLEIWDSATASSEPFEFWQCASE